MAESHKPIKWIGSSLDDLRGFPDGARKGVGFALRSVQRGEKPLNAKPAEGHRGANVMKIVENFDGNTYRAVYTVKFEEAIYVLHCFQKQSKSGIATPKQDLDLINQRLKTAEAEHKKCLEEQKKSK